MSNRPRSPLMATVNVTGVCNLQCRYCFFQPRQSVHMLRQDFSDVLDVLCAEEVFLLTISGGEPFTHPDIGDMLREAHTRFPHVMTLTNGTLINDKHLKSIEAIVDSKGAFPIQVSLDAIDSDTNALTRGASGRVLKSITQLREIGAHVTVAAVVTSCNIQILPEVICQLAKVVNRFHIMPVKPVRALKGADADLSVSASEMETLWRTLQSVRETSEVQLRTPHDDCNNLQTVAQGAPCMAGFSQLVIDPDLDVRPCDRCTTAKVGSLRENSLRDIWESDSIRKVWQAERPYCGMPP